MDTYQVGTGSAEITPPVGTPLAGNYRDDYASRGVHAPLRARAAVIRQGDDAVALVSSDLLTAPRTLVEEVRRQVAARCDLSAERILVAAIHTHSGPAVEALTDEGDPDAIQELVIPGIVEACVQAAASARPIRLWTAVAREDRVCFNRRLRLKDGRTVMNWAGPDPESIDRPLGPVDPEIGVLAAGESLDRPRLVAANLALHAAVLAGDNWLMCADWPGHYCEAIGQCFGPEAMAMFLQGALGDVNHIDAWDPRQGRGHKEAQRIGSLVGLAVVGSLRGAEPVSGPLGGSAATVAVPPRRIDAEQLAWARRVAESGDGKPAGSVDGIPDAIFARDQIEMAGRIEPFELEVQVFRLGQVAIVGLPGEFFVEYALEIKRRSPAAVTLVVGLANGSFGYVPTGRAFQEGGYEPTSWRYGKLAPEAGELCIQAAVEQIETLFGPTGV